MTNPFPPPQHVTPFILTTFAYHNSSLKRMTKIINNRKNFFLASQEDSPQCHSSPSSTSSTLLQPGSVHSVFKHRSMSTADVMTMSLFFHNKLKSTVDPKVKIYIFPWVSILVETPMVSVGEAGTQALEALCESLSTKCPQISKNYACVWSTKGLNRLRLDLHCRGILT